MWNKSARVRGWSLLAFAVMSMGAAPPVSFRPADDVAKSLRAWRSFNDRHGGRWSVEWNQVTGTPHRIYGHYLQLPQSATEANVKAISDRVLRDSAAVLQIRPEQLQLARAERQGGREGQGGPETWFVSYRQVHRGVPVIGGSVQLVIRGDRVTSLGSDFFSGVTLATRPRLTRTQAIRAVQRDRGDRKSDPVGGRLVVYPSERQGAIRYHLAWELTLGPEKDRVPVPTQPGAFEPGMVEWRYLIDANDGSVLERANLMRQEDVTGTVTGDVHPLLPTDAAVQRPLANLTVRIDQGTSAPFSATDASGNYRVTGLTAGTGDLQANLAGPRLRVWNDETADPDATHAATAVTVPGAHSWNWGADDPSPADAETNAFFHVDLIQSWFTRGAPFDVLATPSPFSAHVRNGAYCNAYAGPDGLYFGSGLGTCPDLSLCADVSYHEYTHRIAQTVYDSAGVSFPYVGEPGAMNEGWADYFGTTNTGNPSLGAGCIGAGRNIDVPDHRYPENWWGETHWDGMIFSGAIWDVRSAMGPAYADALTMRAMKRTESTFRGFLRALLEEDDDPTFDPSPLANSNPADGTPNAATLCHAFSDLHGIFHPYCAGRTQRPVAQISLPDPISTTVFDGSSTIVVVEGTAAGSSISALSAYVIDWMNYETPGVFSRAGVTLAGGGTSAVIEGHLGDLDISGLRDGFYALRLTATEAAGPSTSVTVGFIVDRAMIAGWPRVRGSSFSGSPAIADLDPAFPGLEIVAVDQNGQLYVWHADGTNAPGFPVSGPQTSSAQAIGDINGDGRPEIVVAGYWGAVYAFTSSGAVVPGWPRATGGSQETSGPALADLDGDGRLDVVVGSRTSRVFAWRGDGTPIAGWPVSTTAEVQASPAIADLDRDGRPEVVVGTQNGSVHAWSATGTPLPGWPVVTGPSSQVSASVGLGDIDGDGDMEIVAGTIDSTAPANQKVYAWHHNGAPVAGWPRDFANPPVAGGFQAVPASIVLADLTGDFRPEVVAMSNDDNVHVWRGDGTALAGWPPGGTATNPPESWVSSPAVGDLDGDGDVEVLVEGEAAAIGRHRAGRLFGFHHDGTSFAVPRFFPGWGTTPAIADLDADGRVEAVMAADGVRVWKLGLTSAASAEWPLYRGNARRTGAYELPDLTVSSLTHAPSAPTTSTPITFQSEVKNVGARPSAPSQLSFRVGGETPPAATFTVPSLAPGASAVFSRVLTLTVAQKYRNTAVADWDTKVCESNEGNNQRTDDYSVTVCVEGETREVRCTVDGRAGVRTDRCTGGQWVAGVCRAPQCTDGDEKYARCVIDGKPGYRHLLCVNGRWSVGPCRPGQIP